MKDGLTYSPCMYFRIPLPEHKYSPYGVLSVCIVSVDPYQGWENWPTRTLLIKFGSETEQIAVIVDLIIPTDRRRKGFTAQGLPWCKLRRKVESYGAMGVLFCLGRNGTRKDDGRVQSAWHPGTKSVHLEQLTDPTNISPHTVVWKYWYPVSCQSTEYSVLNSALCPYQHVKLSGLRRARISLAHENPWRAKYWLSMFDGSHSC